jgi:Domain of unknown function (DUF4136)
LRCEITLRADLRFEILKMNLPPKRWIALLSLLLLCACSPNVAVNYDKNTDFSRYRTYGWGKGTPAKNPDLDRQIVESIDEQLARKGFTKTDGDPDLVVTYHAATHEEVDYHDPTYGSGGGPATGSPISASAADVPMKVRVGEIVVDMYDAKQQRNVWHGVGSDLVMDDPAKTSAEIRKGAVKMFEKFPPSK